MKFTPRQTVLRLPAFFGLANYDDLRDCSRRLPDDGIPAMVLDLTGCEYCDPSTMEAIRIQELRPRLVHATQEFSQENGRSPTPRELAGILGLGLDEVTEAIIAWDSYNPLSLDAPAEGAAETDTDLIVDHLGAEDPDLHHVVERKTLWSLLSELPERQRTIVLLRFFGNQTQTQIAEQFGISQMHVSRLLSKSLLQLRHGMLPA